MKKSLLLSALVLPGALLFLSPLTAFADPTEVPGNAIEEYLSEDMKTIPDGVHIPYPEDVEKFKDSPLYKFLDKITPDVKDIPAPSGGRCGVNKKLFENA